MTRTLPWLKQPVTSAKSSTRERPAKRQKLSDLESDDESVPTARRIAIRERSPSTSPPPEPPTEELMREGLEYDDIYIMVEDEFQAVARTFTQHLHHAEYVRLKNLAKSHNASTIQSLSRPVDSRTAVRQDTRKKFEAETLRKDVQKTLQQIKSVAGANGEGDTKSDLDLDKEDDPWVGTSLQSLMTSPRKSQNSLTGLAGIKFGSRAAAGYKKAKPQPTAGSITSRKAPSDLRHDAIPDQDVKAVTWEDDDDLDAPSIKIAAPATKSNRILPRSSRIQESLFAQFARPKKPPDPQSGNITSRYQLQASSNAPTERPINANAALNARSRNSKSIFQPFDDFPQPKTKSHHVSSRIGKRMAELKAEKARKEQEQKRKATSLNEIPTFLV